MNDRARHQQRGFTLAEILVTTAIFAVIMIAALSVYDQSNRVFKSGTESADMQQSTRIGFDKLVADLRMAGFDYNRGGDPVAAGQYKQPDEQIEYAGRTALVFRANFNYNTGAATGNGLEKAFTPVDAATGIQIFPFVTTSNDEIVAYVVRSADNTKNTNSLSFYVDSSKPRSAYPGGAAETLITISNALCTTCGIDTTNANPPYTLYRQTLSDILKKVPGTPVAENIRSLNFFYYTDTNGATVLKNTDGTAIANTRDADGTSLTTAQAVFTNEDGTSTTLDTGAIGGAGKYDPANPVVPPANFADRQSRATIQSVRVNVTGMNANPEPNYNQKTETIAAIKNYRQYQLSALVVPRNLGLTGFPEPSNSAPSAPVLTGICTAHCAAPVLCWTPPTGGGPVEQYRIEWDTNPKGSFSNSLTITDPAAVTAIIPDNGSINPSLVWFYQIIATNDNGSSPASQQLSVQPRNSTKPLPPAIASITTSSATNYAVTLGWTAPATNDPAKATSTCTGTGCSTDPLIIPTEESISYNVYRGLAADFDPTDPTEGVKILTIGSTKQPSSSGPGTALTWNDSPTKSAFPPGTCVPYYYRIQAADRCVTSNSYNASGNLNDSLSTIAPPNGQNAIMGTANDLSTALAAAPIGLKADTNTSACPTAVAPFKTCKIDLSWSTVASDSAGNAIGVDKYRITRYRKKLADPGFVLDTTLNGNGTQDVAGLSQTATGFGTYSDSPDAYDFLPTPKEPWYYRYTVAANDCRLGQASTPADFPTSCTLNPVIVQSGASNGSSSADTPGSAWIMAAGDTISVTPSLGLASVKFDVTAYPSGAVIDSVLVSSAPFQYSWVDRTDAQIYQVKMTVTTLPSGTPPTSCTEIHVKYVQDQQPAPCAFANQNPIDASSFTSLPTTTLSESYTLTNTGSDPLQLASKPIKITWTLPAGDTNHPDMVLNAIAYTSTTDNFAGAGPGTVTRSIPASIVNVPAGGTLTITVRWQLLASDPLFVSQPLTKICLDYAILNEPGVIKHCNLVGQSVTTLNPGACD